MSRGLVGGVVGGCVALAGILGVPNAVAAVPAPGLSVSVVAGPTVFSAEHDGGGPFPDSYQLNVTNSGSEPTDGSTIKVSDELPRGLIPTRIVGLAAHLEGSGEPLPCETATVTCTYTGVLQPSESLNVSIGVTVTPGTVGLVTDTAFASGGGAPGNSANVTTAVGTGEESTLEPFGLAAVAHENTGVDGLIDAQAGDHPYETTVSFSLNTVNTGGFGYQDGGGLHGAPAHVKDVVVDVPPGVVGNPGVIEQCPQYKAAQNTCPRSTQIGFAKLSILRRPFGQIGMNTYPMYNVVPDKGYPAEFMIAVGIGDLGVPLYVSVPPDTNYGVRVTTPGIPERGSPTDVQVTFFGTPATDGSLYNEYRKAVSGAAPNAFLDNPVDCSVAPQLTRVSVDSWEKPGAYLSGGQPDFNDPKWVSRSTTVFPSLTGCELLQFNPSLSVLPDTTRADEPAGTTVDLHAPQAPQQVPALITPEIRDTTVTLPSGLSLSPSAGDGLQGCADAQIDLSSASVGSCPSGSQIGTIKVITPLLTEPLEGQVFLGTPNCDPCTNADASGGNMFRLFLQIEGSGVVIKQEGHIYANTTTGQLTTTFKRIPQLPTNDVQLHFNGGLRAGLATPQSCGTFVSTSDFTPWSSPITPDATPSSQFSVDWDGNGGACPAISPFVPSFSAGTSNPNAGQFSPLTVTFGREDREQDLSQIKVVTPPGLVGSLASVPLCGEPQADLGTCSASSQIGTMTVAAGPGSHPFYQQGEIFLTGPYKGAPFGLSIVVPTKAGPFNLGNVVVRSQINVDSSTAALTVTSDPLPQILDGIPLRLRTANVTIDRPNFIFNPTDCAQQHITATISGSQGAQAQESVPFAVAGCAGLPFGPKFTVSTSGKTSRTSGASLDAKVAFPKGTESNIAKVKVDLPKQLPSRLTTLQHACTDRVFNANPAACPVASRIGAVQAITPILPVPLRGPVYFVSHGGAAFPDLVAILQGYGVRVDLVGSTFISKAGITSSTFRSIPDVPVNSFELSLPQGPHSALAANGNLCKTKLLMPTLFVAQDGAQLKQSTQIKVTGCPKTKKTSKAKKAGRAHRARVASQPNSVQGKGN